MSEKEIDLIELIKCLWKARKKVLKYAICGLVLGVIIAFSLPKEYTSKALIAPEERRNNPSSSTGTLALMMGVNMGGGNGGINSALYPEIVRSTPFLLEFANIQIEFEKQKMPLYEYMAEYQKKAWWSYIFDLPGKIMGAFSDKDTTSFENSIPKQQAFANKITESISIEQDSKTGIFQLKSVFQEPNVAKMVLDSLLVKLQHYMNRYQTAKTRANIESNSLMLEEAKSKFYEIDEKYAKVADGSTLITKKYYQLQTERLKNERDLAFQIYSQIALQLESDQIKLQEELQIATIIEPPLTPTTPSAPRKVLIVIALSFLGGFVAATRVIIIAINKK